MAVYDPEALEKMRSIYRDAVSRLSETSGPPDDVALDTIAQDILCMVIANNRSREAIVSSVCAQVDARRKSRRPNAPDCEDTPTDR
jgi:hypothetical protein